MTPAILAIDPGLSGALAMLRADGSLEIHDMPTFALTRGGKAKREIDAFSLARIIDDMTKRAPGLSAVLEQVGAMPGQGVSSMFAFGQSFGIAKGVLAANFIPTELVTPAVWKRAMGVTKDKDSSRARASQVFPRYCGEWSRVKDDGRAEAALLALYAQRASQAVAA